MVAARALDEWDLQVGLLELVSRSENVVFRVETTDKQIFALRIHRPGYHTLSELNSEQAWSRALNEADVIAPLARPTRSGKDISRVTVPDSDEMRHVSLVQWLDGARLDDRLEAAADDGATAAYYEQLGGVMARIHNQAVAWCLPAGFERHAWDADGFMGESPFWGPFWELEQLTAQQCELLLDARESLYRRLCERRKDDGTYSMIHADLHAANVLVSGDRLHVIDLDDAGFGWHPYELAVALFHYGSKSGYEAIRDALVAGYRAERSLSDEIVVLLPMFELIRGLTLLGWYHGRPEIDQAGVPGLIRRVCRDAEGYL